VAPDRGPAGFHHGAAGKIINIINIMAGLGMPVSRRIA